MLLHILQSYFYILLCIITLLLGHSYVIISHYYKWKIM